MTFPLAIVRAAGFFGVLAIIGLSLVPGADRPHTGLPGMVEHFFAYCFTASALAFGFRTRAAWIAITLGLTLLATSMEVLQLWGAWPTLGDQRRNHQQLRRPAGGHSRRSRRFWACHSKAFDGALSRRRTPA